MLVFWKPSGFNSLVAIAVTITLIKKNNNTDIFVLRIPRFLKNADFYIVDWFKILFISQ